MKSIMISLSADIPETELGKAATVTIEGRTYAGTVRIIVIHEADVAPSAVTLEAPGLAVKT